MSSDNPELEQLARALHSGAIHLLRGLHPIDRLSGLTPARLSALSVLVFAGPQTLGRLARIEQVASPTMTRIVDGLVAADLARRTPHPDSARLVRIVATDRGRELMEAAAARRLETIVAAIRLLPAADQRRLVSAGPAFRRLGDSLLSGGSGAAER